MFSSLSSSSLLSARGCGSPAANSERHQALATFGQVTCAVEQGERSGGSHGGQWTLSGQSTLIDCPVYMVSKISKVG